jgi:hypothetical protein
MCFTFSLDRKSNKKISDGATLRCPSVPTHNRQLLQVRRSIMFSVFLSGCCFTAVFENSLADSVKVKEFLLR